MPTLDVVLVASDAIDELYSSGVLTIVNAENENLSVNDYVLLSDSEDTHNAKTTIARYRGSNTFTRLHSVKSDNVNGFMPRNGGQRAMMDALLDPEIKVIVVTGRAGTGKSHGAVAYAAKEYLEHKKKIYLSKSMFQVGGSKWLGITPGEIEDKYAPYLDSYKIVLQKILGNAHQSWIDTAMKKKDLVYLPIELSRGTTYEGCTFILDEAQNFTWSELLTIVSRIGQDSKIIILGDLHQIDSKLKTTDTGLYKILASNTFKQSSITTSINLHIQYRSDIVEMITNVDNELRSKN